MIKPLVISAIIGAIISLVLTPVVIAFAISIGAVDKPNARKVHGRAIPRLGGVVIAISFLLSVLLLFSIEPSILARSWLLSREGYVLVGVLLLMLFLGIWDDLRELRPSQKFVVQFILSNIIYFSGSRISSVTNLFGANAEVLGFLNYPLTVFWIVGITNALNLIDGLDGLAAGVATIAFISIAPISLLNGDIASAALSIVLVGTLLGFIRYNFNPARIFLGDSGSLVLGFLLAVLSLKSATKGTATFAILTPVLALGLPITETILSMVRRFLRSFLPEQTTEGSFLQKLKTMFQPDRGHIHYMLLTRGLSHRTTVLLLYLVSCALGIGAFAVTIANNLTASLILLVVGAASIVGVRQLKYKEMAVLENGVLLPLYDRPIMNRDSIQAFLDIAFMIISFLTASYLTREISSGTILMRSSMTNLALVVGVQFSVFLAMGLYRGVFKLVGTDEILGIIKTVSAASFVSYVLLRIVGAGDYRVVLVASILNFFFLFTFVAGFRSSFSMLRHMYHRHPKSGRKLLIYGADINGLWMLEKILQLNYSSMMPIGFVDENPHLEGRSLNGYPVFGGHKKLAELIKTVRIDEIILCCESMKADVLDRVKSFADENGILLTRAMIVFEEVAHEVRVRMQSAPTLHYAKDKGARRPIEVDEDENALISSGIPVTSFAENAG